MKEPWQMTKAEWLADVGYKNKQGSRVRENWLATHEVEVGNAVRSGKPVPEAVLKDYPDLAKPSNPSVSKKAITEAEQGAKDEIARLIRESRSTEDALKSARMELEAIEGELGKRTIPYGGDFYRKRRGRLPQAFPGVPAAILDTKRTVYREFIEELEQQLAIPKTRKQMLIDYDRGHSLGQLKEMCRNKGFAVSGGKKELIARLI